MIQTNRPRPPATSIRLHHAEQEALAGIADALHWSQENALRLAVCHLHQTMAHGEPVYMTLPPHDAER